jgi:hypothetical protein
MSDKKYINLDGNDVPDNKIVVIPFEINANPHSDEILEPLVGKIKRDWFTSHFYYCLPLNIGNQYGFLVKSAANFDVIWDGTESDAEITFLDNSHLGKQNIDGHFGHGIITFQNLFSLKTAPGINLMTIQPPNIFIPGCSIMTGVVEADQIRRDFTFNLKVTVPNYKISIRKGDAIGAFIPIPRYFVDKFEISTIYDEFDQVSHQAELDEMREFGRQRQNEDSSRPHESGRKYFNGEHAFGESFADHQRRVE